MRKITGKQVKEFSEMFSTAIGFRIVEKSTLMWLLSKAARKVTERFSDELVKIDKALRPMAVYKFVFLTFKIGEDAVDYVEQILTIVHEAVHVIRIRKWCDDGGSVVSWYRSYFDPTKPMFRATEEAICIAAEEEIRRKLTGKVLSFPDLTKSYLIGKSDQAAAEGVAKTLLEAKGPTSSTVREAEIVLKRVGIL